jgi:3-mercaptopropionate dioxygenase
MTNLARFRGFIKTFTQLVEKEGTDEQRIFDAGQLLLKDLIVNDDWLPNDFSRPDPNRYQQYLLHCDPLERFSVVSFVWGPGQSTPVHDHTVWGLVGVMRGKEICEEFIPDNTNGQLIAGGKHTLLPGNIDRISPRVGDIHRVSNAQVDGISVSIHVYGANIGATSRHTYDPVSGAKKLFISGYSNLVIPNYWDRSLEK